MAGLIFYYNVNTGNKFSNYLDKLKNVYNVPNINYKEEYQIGENFLVYSCIPNFIKDDKVIKINNYIISIDGDFYNEEDLCTYLNIKKLTKLEIIYHLYKKEGNNFAEKLNGEFNIVIYDVANKEILVVNDRFARRPFFYKQFNNGIAFSSEKKGLITISEEKSTMDNIGIFQIVSTSHNFNRRTFIQDIKKSKPADVIIFKNNKLTINQYFIWKYNEDHHPIDKEQVTKELYEKLRNSLARRLKNKDRIMLWLSGGMDSRSLALSINKEIRNKITVESYGESYSEELGIVKELCSILGYNLNTRKVTMSYTKFGRIGNWRTEFAIVPFEHVQSSFHNEMKRTSDYILAGVPGFDVFNGGNVSLGKIYGSLFNNYIHRWFISYLRSDYNEMKKVFNIDLLNETYPNLEASIFTALEQVNVKNKLDRYDAFMAYDRQPNFSNISDMYENDLFETLHPYNDTELFDTFLKIPLNKRIFQQLSKDMLYKYYPEVRHIRFDGRGKLNKNNSLWVTFGHEILNRYYFKKIKYSIWNSKKAFENEIEIVKEDLKRIFEFNDLVKMLNIDFLNLILNSNELMISNYSIVEKILAILYAYETFIYPSELSIPQEVIDYYK
ncbi:MAG: asparagine synthase-related protein [Melioribacteraceae bacterium]